MALPWHLYIMALIYLLAGLNHFRNPKLYLKIMPPYIPLRKEMNYLSGIAEIVFAFLLCSPVMAPVAAWGIIVLLIAFYPVHFYMLKHPKVSFDLPKWFLKFRIWLQLLLILWAYQYT